MPAGEGYQREVSFVLQLVQDAADRGFRDAPAQCQVTEVRQRVAGGVAEVDHRPQFRALHLAVVVDGMYP